MFTHFTSKASLLRNEKGSMDLMQTIVAIILTAMTFGGIALAITSVTGIAHKASTSFAEQAAKYDLTNALSRDVSTGMALEANSRHMDFLIVNNGMCRESVWDITDTAGSAKQTLSNQIFVYENEDCTGSKAAHMATTLELLDASFTVGNQLNRELKVVNKVGVLLSDQTAPSTFTNTTVAAFNSTVLAQVEITAEHFSVSSRMQR